MKDALKSELSKGKTDCLHGQSVFFFLALAASLSLSACSPFPPQVSIFNMEDRERDDASLIPAERKSIEDSAWAQLNELSFERCGAMITPPEREKAIEQSQCITALIEEYVVPNALFPEILIASRIEALRIAKQYADRKISAAEYKKKSEKRLKKYQVAIGYMMNQRLASAE